MARIATVALALGLALAALPGATALHAQESWVQIEAQPTLVRAEERARAWAGQFADVAGFRLASGWYAIALGPYPREDAQRRLALLKATAAIPADSYLTEADRLGPRFWPAGAGALAGEEAILTQPLPDAPPPDALPPEAAAGPGSPAEGAAAELAALPAEAAGPGAAQTPAAFEPSPAPAAPAAETLAEARRGEAQLGAEERRELQQALAYEGLYAAAIDGAFGAGTRAAMAEWQQAQGQEGTGVLTSAQRAALLGGFRTARDSLGLGAVEQAAAGIALRLPLALLAPPVTRPPFVHYPARRDGGDGTSGVQVLLISQPGDAARLASIFQQVQGLQAVPLDGERRLDATGFTLEGADAQHLAHAEARLAGGQIKGFVLVWPRGDDRRRAFALAAMQESFRALPGAVLPDPAREGRVQPVNLVAGMERRRPDVARTGFYIDARGHVLTSADAVAACSRVTLEDDVPARVLARDPGLGLALLAPEEPLAPLAHARWRAAPLQPGTEVAVAGYAWEGRLGAAVVSFGRLVEAQGPDGDAGRHRLQLEVTPGEAGAPVLDGSGAVTGLLLSQEGEERILPDGVRFALPAARIAAYLSEPALAQALGGPPELETGTAAPLSLSALDARARDLTVAVGCWN